MCFFAVAAIFCIIGTVNASATPNKQQLAGISISNSSSGNECYNVECIADDKTHPILVTDKNDLKIVADVTSTDTNYVEYKKQIVVPDEVTIHIHEGESTTELAN